MQVCTMASARATIGGPRRESRTPSRAAAFQLTTTLSRDPAARLRWAGCDSVGLARAAGARKVGEAVSAARVRHRPATPRRLRCRRLAARHRDAFGDPVRPEAVSILRMVAWRVKMDPTPYVLSVI